MDGKQAELTPGQQEALQQAYYHFQRNKAKADRVYDKALQQAYYDFATHLKLAGIDPAGYSPG